MKINEILETHKECFLKFKEENDNAFLSAIFVSADFNGKIDQISLDFFIPSLNRIAVFESPDYMPVVHDDDIKEMKEQSTSLKIDIDNLREEVSKITEEFSGFNASRLIAVLKENVWNVTVMNNALGIIKIKLNAVTGEKISAEKGSFMDFARK